MNVNHSEGIKILMSIPHTRYMLPLIAAKRKEYPMNDNMYLKNLLSRCNLFNSLFVEMGCLIV